MAQALTPIAIANLKPRPSATKFRRRLSRAAGGGVSIPSQELHRPIPVPRLAAQADLGSVLDRARRGRIRHDARAGYAAVAGGGARACHQGVARSQERSRSVRRQAAQRQQELAAESDTLAPLRQEYLRREGPRLRTVNQREADLEIALRQRAGTAAGRRDQARPVHPRARSHRRSQRPGARRPCAVARCGPC